MFFLIPYNCDSTVTLCTECVDFDMLSGVNWKINVWAVLFSDKWQDNVLYAWINGLGVC